MTEKCPICGRNDCKVMTEAGSDYTYHFCKKYQFKFYLSNAIQNESDFELKERMLDLIAEHLLHNRNCIVDQNERIWYFDSNELVLDDTVARPEYMNIAILMTNYPEQVIEKANRALVNLSLIHPHYGDYFIPQPTEERFLFSREASDSIRPGIYAILQDLGYLSLRGDNKSTFRISATGWQKIAELQREEQIVRQGFIAMAFREETKHIREAFRDAIVTEGYSVAIIDEKEHNNQIVPEIFYEIERSKFVVVDVTYPNYGAYYEAGYAQALGKQVIICCSQEAFSSNETRPHFDISQKCMIVWKDYDDLVQRLRRRIQATVK